MKQTKNMFEEVEPKEPINLKPSCECPVCYEPLGETNVCITKCGHKFCIGCLFRHSERSNDCPMCREQIVDNFESRNNRSRSASFNDDEFINRINEGLSVPVDDLDNFMRRGWTTPQVVRSTYNVVDIPDNHIENNIIDLTNDIDEEISITYDDDETTVNSENDSNQVNDEEKSIESLISELNVIQEVSGVYELSIELLEEIRHGNNIVESVKMSLLKQTIKKYINYFSENTYVLLDEKNDASKQRTFMRLNNVLNNEEECFETYINEYTKYFSENTDVLFDINNSDDIMYLLVSTCPQNLMRFNGSIEPECVKLCKKFTDLIFDMSDEFIVDNRDRN